MKKTNKGLGDTSAIAAVEKSLSKATKKRFLLYAEARRRAQLWAKTKVLD